MKRRRSITVWVACLVITAASAHAQSVVDGLDAAIEAKQVALLLGLIGQRLHSPDAKVTNLHAGRAGALCGAVDVRNRMGTYTGPRGFVADLSDNFFGRLPEGPELRSPASMLDFKAMERAKVLFAENCAAP